MIAAALRRNRDNAPRTVAAMREQLAQSQAQDRAALAERAELMRTLSALLGTLQLPASSA